ncbi:MULTISPECIES: citrate lyase holo-[acyl-carrier protein] synthase [Pectobacterium]|uniref:citrate lyase holo-[acyl-carrier protein] synthase n=1 Tax=Pectobacterium TaxID=122277 RepID=UPI0015F05A05|nr:MULTISPECIES: citrate lyase holo-[acyl-carrier protein] synthase [Pectobacterium]MBA5227522.1 citrate lyase holo-[acyl-carrier protein] synthase [Pectobacterium aroidearum]MBA5735913.1 citrate lyase holo-[acyl-carrier protein] synthase [Pectobacterium aroidearum]UXK02537.1 citrate lyase holo-[acyl-carrier protein] synthase [Pectobacterium aroidearum]
MTNAVSISLETLLAAKECRAVRQQEWLTRHDATLVSLTLVTPGPVKDSEGYRQVMAEAIKAFTFLRQARGWMVLEQQTFWLATGAEALWAITKDALSVKAATIALEDSHELGRLWDFDIFSPEEGAIGRSMLAHSGRSCLLCNQMAHACSRSRRHSLSELLEHIEDKVNAYFTPA